MVGVAAPERAVFTNDAPAAADLSPTKEAMQAAFPVITPATLPAEVSHFPGCCHIQFSHIWFFYGLLGCTMKNSDKQRQQGSTVYFPLNTTLY